MMLVSGMAVRPLISPSHAFDMHIASVLVSRSEVHPCLLVRIRKLAVFSIRCSLSIEEENLVSVEYM